MLSSLVRWIVRAQSSAAAVDTRYATQLTRQGIASLEAGDPETAIGMLERALRAGGDGVDVLTGLGAAYRALDEPQRSVEYFLRALDAPGPHPRFARLRNCGIVFQELGQTARARTMLEEAAGLKPDDAEVHVDIALLSFESGDFASGQTRLEHALHLDPDNARAHLAFAADRLAEGDYARGWPEYQWRLRAGGFEGRVPAAGRHWTNDGRTGTVCATWEQGLGDQIMYASCVPDLAACVERTIVECDPRLVTLMRRSFPAVEVRTAAAGSDQTRTETWDWEIPMGSLPGIFRPNAGAFPQQAGGYLRADPTRVAYWRQRLRALGAGPAIGISWRGGSPRTRRTLRSIDPETFASMLSAPGAQLVSLQYGDSETDLVRLRAAVGKPIHHWPEVIADYDETAAVVSALDLVISVCTSIVHLAGALGSRAWVLVPQVAEWRYGRRGERMPWYDRVRLYRQTTLGEWQPVLRQIGAALADGALDVRPE